MPHLGTEFQVKQGDDGQFYWRLVRPNGKSVAIGGEGFTREEDAWRAAYDVPAWTATATFADHS